MQDPAATTAPIKVKRTKGFSRSRRTRLQLRWYLLGSVCGFGFALSLPYLTAGIGAIQWPSAKQQEAADIQDSQVEIASATPEELTEPLTPAWPASMNLRVRRGDSLLTVLTDTGVSVEEAQQAVQAIRKIYDPRKLDIGQQVALNLHPSEGDPSEPTINTLSLPLSKTTVVELKRTDSGFSAQKIEAQVEKKLVRAGGKITSSFYVTGANAGIPANTLQELIKAYSYDVDFQRDVKRGNTFETVMERVETDKGEVVGYGKLIYASLQLDNKTLNLYRYTDKSGNTDYYNEKGESLRKALLRTPINGARITSGFGMRMHPLLGYSKMHRGVDFGASIGTPIYAAGDGVIESAGWTGGYGNYVRIKHSDKYETAYGHASRIAPGIRPGVRVKQGQIIAYVGSTGQSTGPHLHYEVLASGAQVNPAGIKFKTGNVLAGKDLVAFKQVVSGVQLAMKEGSAPLPKQLAMAEPVDTKTGKPVKTVKR